MDRFVISSLFHSQSSIFNLRPLTPDLRRLFQFLLSTFPILVLWLSTAVPLSVVFCPISAFCFLNFQISACQRFSFLLFLPASIFYLQSPNFELSLPAPCCQLSLAYIPLQVGTDQSRPAVATRGIASAGNHKKGDGILAVKVSNHRRVGSHGNGILSMVEKPGGYMTAAHKDAGLSHPGRTFALIRIGVRGIKNNRAVRT